MRAVRVVTYIVDICLVCLWDNIGEIIWTSLREYACAFPLKYFYYEGLTASLAEMFRWPFWPMIRASVPRVVNMIIMASSKLFTSILHRLPIDLTSTSSWPYIHLTFTSHQLFSLETNKLIKWEHSPPGVRAGRASPGALPLNYKGLTGCMGR
jgi:hypothetical protein